MQRGRYAYGDGFAPTSLPIAWVRRGMRQVVFSETSNPYLKQKMGHFCLLSINQYNIVM
jgi:hypothetical protein